jgi:glycerol-3-phosphate dehydrogenase
MEKGNANEILKGFLEERWKGIRPVLWGTSLREQELIETIYKGPLTLDHRVQGPKQDSGRS